MDVSVMDISNAAFTFVFYGNAIFCLPIFTYSLPVGLSCLSALQQECSAEFFK
jgi:hypothetical protein